MKHVKNKTFLKNQWWVQHQKGSKTEEKNWRPGRQNNKNHPIWANNNNLNKREQIDFFFNGKSLKYWWDFNMHVIRVLKERSEKVNYKSSQKKDKGKNLRAEKEKCHLTIVKKSNSSDRFLIKNNRSQKKVVQYFSSAKEKNWQPKIYTQQKNIIQGMKQKSRHPQMKKNLENWSPEDLL